MILLSSLRRSGLGCLQTTLSPLLQLQLTGSSGSPTGSQHSTATGQISGDDVQQQQRSGYSTGSRWDITLPSRRGLFSDIPVVSSMLPNRKALTAHIVPHGILFMPRHIPVLPSAASIDPLTGSTQQGAPQPTPGSDTSLFRKQVQAVVRKSFAARPSASQRQAAASVVDALQSAFSGSHLTPQLHALGMEDPHGDEGMLMKNQIKVWRRLKMKKHKIRKRRRLNRHKTVKA